MESIFQSIGNDNVEMEAFATNDEVTTYEVFVKALIQDATDFNDSELSPKREQAIKYYEGIYPPLDDAHFDEDNWGDPMVPDDEGLENRSEAVSTDVKDTVLAIMPSLMRIFTGAETVVTFSPSTEAQSDLAEQQTDYTNYVIWNENDGFLILHDVFKDALTQKIGVVKWWTEHETKVKQREYANLSILQLSQMIQEYNKGDEQPQAQILELVPSQAQQGWVEKVVIQYIESAPKHCFDSVPPEEFRIDRRAKSPKTARLVGHQTLVAPSYLVEIGIPPEVVDEYRGKFDHYTVEADLRTPGIDMSFVQQDMVEYGEYYIRADADGDGIDELHYICVIGNNYDIVSDTVVDNVNMAVFCPDPRPHTVVGDSAADMTMDIQRVNTQILRGTLDSLSASIFPDYVINEMTTNVEDAMADGVGKLIRTRGDPNAAVKEFKKSFVGADAFNMMGYMDTLRQRRTGISEASKGLDPQALQSTAVVGVNAIVSGAQERIELIARIFAETGYKDLFAGLLREITQFPNIKKTIQLRGKWVDVDHSLFDPNLTVCVNPTMGKGSDTNRLMALQSIKQDQMTIIEKFGTANPVVNPNQVLNTIKDMLELANIKNFGRYFTYMTDEQLQAMMNAPKEPTPEDKIATAELEKVKSATAKTIAETATKRDQQVLDEDFRRDKLTLDTLSKIAIALSKVDMATVDTALPTIESQNQEPVGTQMQFPLQPVEPVNVQPPIQAAAGAV